MSLTTLTVTVYMIVQGIAPSFWGSFSDAVGRRGIFIGTFGVYIIANIALGVSNNYGELMAFRALQAAGSAATISIGAGVIGDITTSAERGSLVGIFGGGKLSHPYPQKASSNNPQSACWVKASVPSSAASSPNT